MSNHNLQEIARAAAEVFRETDPVSAETIRLTVGPQKVVSYEPDHTVVSSRSAGFATEDVRGSICQYGHFFASRDTASAYTALHRGVPLAILAPEEAFRIGQLVLEEEPLKSIAEVRDEDRT
jgi:Alkylmercury lyase